jgi:hypothetical protein
MYEVYRKVPGLGQKRNTGLTYSILAAIYFKIVYLGKYTANPSLFSRFKSIVEDVFLHAVECRSLWMSDTVSKRRPFSFIFNLGNKAESQGSEPGE